MSSIGALEGASAGGPGGSSGRKRGCLFGSKNKVKDPATTPSVSHKRACPLGSHNKKTMVALAATAAADSAGAAPAAAVASVGAVAAATTAVTPVEAATALITVVVSVGVAPPGLAAMTTGGSASAAAGMVHKPRRPPAQQRISYTSEHGFTTFLAPLWAGCKVRLLLPFCFIDMMGSTDACHGGGGQRWPAAVPHQGLP
jgi:hypothetical protein